MASSYSDGALVRPSHVLDWFTSATHETIRTDADGHREWVPFGTAHARQVGSRTTACGLVATDWPMFFETKFDVRLPNICRTCVDMVRARPSGEAQ